QRRQEEKRGEDGDGGDGGGEARPSARLRVDSGSREAACDRVALEESRERVGGPEGKELTIGVEGILSLLRVEASDRDRLHESDHGDEEGAREKLTQERCVEGREREAGKTLGHRSDQAELPSKTR